jgi:hypothetical protein
MINAATAKKLNSSIASNMGLIGSTIQMARSNEPDEKAVVEKIQVEQRAITSLLVSIVDYLSRLDQSLKTQSKITRFVYNQQAISQREQAIEQTSTRVEPDAVPVAANDNEEEKTGSALGALASGLLITATGLLVANYKSVMDKLKSAASMLGLGADVATQQAVAPSQTTEDLTSPSPTAAAPPVKQAQQQPAMSRPARSNPLSKSTGGSNPVPQSTGGSNPVPIQANRVAAPPPVSSAPVATGGATAAPASTSPAPAATGGSAMANVVQVSHPDTGSGFGIAGAKDQQGRPIAFTKEGAEAFARMMADSGGVVKPSDVASSKRSVEKNSEVGGAANSPHLHGVAMDIHGTSEPWIRQHGNKYGWNPHDYSGTHGGHFVYGGASSVGTGDNGGILGSEGPIAQSFELVREGLSRALKHLKPTNMMTRKIGDEALNREMDLMAKPPSTGRQQGHFGKPEAAKIPSPIQQSAAKTGVDVTSQYMFMFFGERPQAASVSNLTQSK